MADFMKAFKKTDAIEGKYSDDKDDAGGETYRGISRVYNPNWTGWVLIDQYKGTPSFPSCLDFDNTLSSLVIDFYKEKYWDVNKLDNPVFTQKLGDEMYDSGVNLGTGRIAEILQKSLNYLNRNEKLFTSLKVDGKIGTNTFNALKIVMPKDEEVLLKIINVLQGMRYLDYTDRKPTQKKYIRGWFGHRINL